MTITDNLHSQPQIAVSKGSSSGCDLALPIKNGSSGPGGPAPNTLKLRGNGSMDTAACTPRPPGEAVRRASPTFWYTGSTFWYTGSTCGGRAGGEMEGGIATVETPLSLPERSDSLLVTEEA